ncbi:Mce protein [Mycobacterium sp. 29Ha]|uniref:Mce protein n=1 Tax=Mycobacterium sp. 29Ha TaxID=2939268 RepID=UPI002938D563|nr:Mce protein [Mycobacterium sp. 29Ha]MDV3132829.1 Mce protein [Mycobacterium sp. 29Ha]
MADDVAPGDGDVSKSTPETEPAEVSRKDRETEAIAAELDSVAAEPESTAVEEDKREERVAVGADADEPDPADGDAEDYDEEAAPAKSRMSHVRLATIAGLVAVVALAGLTGWLGFNAYKSYKAEEQRKLFLQVGRQGALNLTTIDWQHAETDVQRVLDSSTGTFYDDFQNRAAPFVEVVKQAQSKSVGSISEAGLESESENGAQVLVAVTVNTTNAGAPEQQPRSWRMRISVEKVGGDAKVSNVEFVP